MYRNKIWNTKFMMLSFFQGCGHRVFVRAPKMAPRRCQGSHVWQKQLGVPDAVSDLGQSRRFDPSKNHAPTITLANSLARFNEHVSKKPQKPRNHRFSKPAISLQPNLSFSSVALVKPQCQLQQPTRTGVCAAQRNRLRSTESPGEKADAGYPAW